MAEVSRRQHARVKGAASPGPPAHRDEEGLGMEAETMTVFIKLLAAGFYGVSSFLIVVVNKSVLSGRRYGGSGDRVQCAGRRGGSRRLESMN